MVLVTGTSPSRYVVAALSSATVLLGTSEHWSLPGLLPVLTFIYFLSSSNSIFTLVEQCSEGIWFFEVVRPIPITLPVEDQIRQIYERGYMARAWMYRVDTTGWLTRVHQCTGPLA